MFSNNKVLINYGDYQDYYYYFLKIQTIYHINIEHLWEVDAGVTEG